METFVINQNLIKSKLVEIESVTFPPFLKKRGLEEN